MAARTVSSRGRKRAVRANTTAGNAPGLPAHTVGTRSPRERSLAQRAAAAVDIAFAGQRVRLDGIALDVRIGAPLGAQSANAFAALFDAGIVPSLRPRRHEEAGPYLERSLAAFGERFADLPAECFFEPTPQSVAKKQTMLTMSLRWENPTAIIAQRLHDDLAAYSPRLCGELFDQLGRASEGLYDVFTPARAIDASLFLRFNGDARDWWEYQRDEAAQELGIAEGTHVGWELVRKYLRHNEITSPGALRREIGAHHFVPVKRLRSLAALRAQAERAPGTLRERVITWIDAMQELQELGSRITRTDAEQRAWEQTETGVAWPRAVIETSAERRLVFELVDELFDYESQGSGFGPNIIVVFSPDAVGCARMLATLETLQRAEHVLEHILLTIGDIEA